MRQTKLLLLFLFFFVLGLKLYAQEYDWGGTISGEYFDIASDVLVDEDDFIYTIGYFRGTVDFDFSDEVFFEAVEGARNIFIQKSDSLGNLIWFRTIEGEGSDKTNNAVFNNEGNIVITGLFQGSTDFDPGIETYTIEATGGSNIYVLTISREGNFIDVLTIPSEGSAQVSSISIDPLGGIYISGKFNDILEIGDDVLTAESYSDGFMAKFSSEGEYLWSHKVGGYGAWDNATGILVNGEQVCLFGHFSDIVDFDPGPEEFNLTSAGLLDAYIQILDYEGNFINAITFGNREHNSVGNWSIGPDGNIYTSGKLIGTIDLDFGPDEYNLIQESGRNDIYFCKYNSAFELVWARQFEAGNEASCNSPQIDSENNIYLGGYYTTGGDFNPNEDEYNSLPEPTNSAVYFMKLDPIGDFQWVRSINGASSSFLTELVVSSRNNIYVAGTFSNSLDLNAGLGVDSVYNVGRVLRDFFLTKYDECHLPIFDFRTVEACDSFVMPSGNKTYYDSGIYVDSMLTYFGCENIITIDLTIINGFYEETIITSCDSFYWRGVMYGEGGRFVESFTSENGCDSIYSLALEVRGELFDTIVTSCSNFLWDDSLYIESTLIADTMVNIHGCDSIININLLVNRINSELTYDGEFIWSHQDDASYQWFNCEERTLILGATEQFFRPLEFGRFAVIISYDGCTDTSLCYRNSPASISVNDDNSIIQIYPNPTYDNFRFNSPFNSPVDFLITNMKGQIVKEFYSVKNYDVIDISNIDAGVYSIIFLDKLYQKPQRIVKL